MVNYDKLWKLTEAYGMSKSDLMQKLDISSATFAKLSSNQQVAMDVLEKICNLLSCSIENIVSFTDDGNENARWSRIDQDKTYLFNLYFLLPKQNVGASYLYGFACPFHMSDDGMNDWHVTSFGNDSEIYELKGYCTGKTLLLLVHRIEDGISLGQLLDLHKINLMCDSEYEEILRTLTVCNGTAIYRPGYLLETNSQSIKLVRELRPQVSIEDQMMICESLITTNTCDLYTQDGRVDASKARRLFDFLHEIYPQASYNDMSRLGNFEVFSYLYRPAGCEKGLSWKVMTHEDKKHVRKVADGIEIKLDHHILSGQFGLCIRAANTKNVFLDRMILVSCEKQDMYVRIPLQESPSSVSIRLYQLSLSEAGTNLVADSSSTLIRSIRFDMHIVEQRFRLEDKWSTLLKQADKKLMESEDAKCYMKSEYYSREAFSMENEGNEPWLTEEEQVSKECQELLGFSNNQHEGVFLENGKQKHLRFLNWLKELLGRTRSKHVILIDPYVESTALAKLLRSISNIGIRYDVYTHEGQISEEDIKQFRVIAPPKICIYTLPKDSLHDRLLILADGDSLFSQIFMLSNSLDHCAEKHASVVLPVTGAIANQLEDYYIRMIGECEKSGKVKEIFWKKEAVEAEEKEVEAHDRTVIDNLSAFELLCKEDFNAALEQLAYMKPELSHRCMEYLETSKDTEAKLITTLEQFISGDTQALDRVKSDSESYYLRRMIAIVQLLNSPTDMHMDLLHSAENYYDSYYDFRYNNTNWSIYYATYILCKHYPMQAIAYLERLLKKIAKEQIFTDERQYIIANYYLMHFTDLLVMGQLEEEVLLQAEIPLLHMLVVVHGYRSVKVGSQELESGLGTERLTEKLASLCSRLEKREKVLAHLLWIEQLQILCVRNQQRYRYVQPVIDEIIGSMVNSILSIATTASENQVFGMDDLYHALFNLYLRNSEDICKVILGLHQRKYVTNKQATKFLLTLILHPYKEGMYDTNDRTFFQANTIEESCMILAYMMQIDGDSLKAVLTEVKKMERKLGNQLYSAFLKVKNYSLWKRYMDMFCCLVSIELFIHQKYGTKCSSGVLEFQNIASNYAEQLNKYSEVYRWIKVMFPEFAMGVEKHSDN